jgi:hypothetical protein
MDRGKIRNMTLADVEARVKSGKLNWGTAKEVADTLIETAERAGADSLVLNMNVGAMPHAQFIAQLRRFGAEVLPRLQAHRITRVPNAA